MCLSELSLLKSSSETGNESPGARRVGGWGRGCTPRCFSSPIPSLNGEKQRINHSVVHSSLQTCPPCVCSHMCRDPVVVYRTGTTQPGTGDTSWSLEEVHE